MWVLDTIEWETKGEIMDFQVAAYTYYDSNTCGLDFAGAMKDISAIPEVLLCRY